MWENPYSSFYRKKYKKAGVNLIKDVNSLEEFYKLPYLTRKEIASTGPYERLFLPKKEIEAIWFSSGTTDVQNPSIFFHTSLHPIQQRLFSEFTTRLPIKNIMLLFSNLPIQARLLREWFGHPLKNKDAISICGDINNLALSARIARIVKIDAIKTTPTILYFFIPYLKKEYDPDKILYIFLGGEFCSEQKANFFKKVFRNAFIQFNFGGNETEIRGYRCKFLYDQAPWYFHPVPVFHFETLNPKQESELIITHLFKNVAFPLIRYKTEDSVKIELKSCRCGEKKIMEVFGKLEYDVARIHGTTLYAENIYKALSPFSKYLVSSDFQLHVYEKVIGSNILPQLTLQIRLKSSKLKDSLNINNLIAKGISSKLYLSAKMTLSQLVERQVFLPLEIEFIEEFPLEVKRKRIISHLI